MATQTSDNFHKIVLCNGMYILLMYLFTFDIYYKLYL
jgi:hypothetical protein